MNFQSLPNATLQTRPPIQNPESIYWQVIHQRSGPHLAIPLPHASLSQDPHAVIPHHVPPDCCSPVLRAHCVDQSLLFQDFPHQQWTDPRHHVALQGCRVHRARHQPDHPPTAPKLYQGNSRFHLPDLFDICFSALPLPISPTSAHARIAYLPYVRWQTATAHEVNRTLPDQVLRPFQDALDPVPAELLSNVDSGLRWRHATD